MDNQMEIWITRRKINFFKKRSLFIPGLIYIHPKIRITFYFSEVVGEDGATLKSILKINFIRMLNL